MFNHKIRNLIIFLTLVGMAFSGRFVSAHVLQSDGNIGAVLHIDPDDDPIIGQPATFFFEIKDKQNKFQPQNCICTVSVSDSNNKSLYSQNLFSTNTLNNLSDPLFQYTFQNKGIYTIKLAGSANIGAAPFQTFTLNYPIRVARTTANTASTSANSFSASFKEHFVHYILFGGAFLVILIMYLYELFKQNKAKKDHINLKVIIAFLILFACSFGNLVCHLADSKSYRDFAAQHQCCVSAPSLTANQSSRMIIVVNQTDLPPIGASLYKSYLTLNHKNKSPPIIS